MDLPFNRLFDETRLFLARGGEPVGRQELEASLRAHRTALLDPLAIAPPCAATRAALEQGRATCRGQSIALTRDQVGRSVGVAIATVAAVALAAALVTPSDARALALARSLLFP